MSRRSLPWILSLLLSLFLITASACGEDEPATSQGTSRVGEACQDNLDCARNLLCLSTENRCVTVCTPGDETCGEGIACQAAGDTGFCPLPPP